MAIKEQATNQKVLLVFNELITTNTATTGFILDTADYDLGVYFAMGIIDWDNTAANFSMTIYEGDESDLSDATLVPDSKLVYSDDVELDELTADGSALIKQGCHSTKRYLRVTVTSTGVDTSAHVIVLAIVNPELVPTDQN